MESKKVLGEIKVGLNDEVSITIHYNSKEYGEKPFEEILHDVLELLKEKVEED